ncbi:MAG: GGDEF domain-containing protein [Actinobacteria bacterium]|nr:GGDEF domain-containing protein [Actinomycetota bacterium]
MTIAIYAASVALATLCIVLFFVAVRRLLGRQEEIVATMLQRYDDRLAEFAQALNDALNRPQPTLALPVDEATRAIPEHGVMRLLELAKERMSADAAVAVVSAPSKEPMLATVGLSQAEVAQVGRMGVPDYRGARALQVAFNGEAATPPGSTPIRSGLAVPLLDVEDGQGMLAVLTRAPERRFSEMDITTLEDVVSGTRPALEASLELREADPVPELDALTELYDRRAFHALLERELSRARGRREPLALVMLDIDRLTTINARVGHLAADGILVQVAALLRDVAGRDDLPCRIGGGRFGALLPGGDTREAERLFERLQATLRERPFPEVGVVTISAGATELMQSDDAAALLGRADAALGLAKVSGRDTVVAAAHR